MTVSSVNQRRPSNDLNHNQVVTNPGSPLIGHESPLVSILKSPPPQKPKISATTPWKRFKLFDSPFPRYRHAASSISSDKNEIFLMGGLKEGSVFGDTWKVIPQENHGEIVSYTSVSIDIINHNNPPARVGHSSVLCGNAFIIFGGDTVDTDFNGFPDNNFYLFNINNNKYTIPSHILNKPNGRYGHTVGVISLNNNSSRLYLFGGQLENDVFNDLYYFELNTFKSPKARWELVEPLNNFKPPPLTNHSMAVYKTNVYVFGGVYNNERVSNDLWSYDALANKWTQIPTTGNIPLPVNEHSSCIVEDKLYVYGGNDFKGVIYNSLYVLDLNSFVWSKLTDVGDVDGPGPRCGHSMTYLQKFNKLLIMGGDKNDYVVDDPTNFETYENYNGEEIGTMIYELDVGIVDHFLTETVVEPLKPPKKVAASAAKNVDNEGFKGYENHARSFSAGPEDFKTPSGSPPPERAELNHNDDTVTDPIVPPNDRFVEVDLPNTTIEDSGGAAALNSNKPAENPYHNGHASLLDNYDYGDSNENIQPVTPSDSQTKEIESIPDPNLTPMITPHLNQDDSRIKRLVAELTNELTQLKSTTKMQMQNATEKIQKLEQENDNLRGNHSRDIEGYEKQLNEKSLLIDELKSTIDPTHLNVDEKSPEGSNVSELSKYKLERLELNNKLLYLEQENSKLKSKFEDFEPFMNNQVGELNKFQKLIKAHEEKIAKLSSQTKDQELLTKEINDWKHKYENLSLEYENYKNIHSEEEISDDEEFDSSLHNDSQFDEPSNRSIVSAATSTGRRSKKDISNQLEALVNLWNSKNQARTVRESTPGENPITPENNPIVAKLQEQVDDLLRISKQNDQDSNSQIGELKTQLQDKLSSLKSFEENYRDALQSVNNTSKALKASHDELTNQRSLMEKLVKENNELKLFKKANKRISTRNASPIFNNSQIPEVNEEDDDDDGEGEVFNSAHYNMKIKDLEADLFVLKQERDSLKENVTSLQKQLYLSKSSD
ncbi:hypothetical protein DFJ63DRAFT_288980 [Scheffersomyces coipomensis]|uniref:uncharacterized protein n=1 Tax=Scheffersomyces coipomensis TaxID=1788519 RepID=UPI00315D3517